MQKRDDDLIAAWLMSAEAQGLSPNTTDRRRVAVNSFRRFLAPLDLAHATTAVAEDWLLTLRGLSTRHAYNSDLAILYKWALRRSLLRANPFEDIPPTKVPQGAPRPFTREQIDRLLRADLDPMYSLMIRLGLYAGLRVSEIASLCWEDLRLIEGGTLTVRKGKGGKVRVLPVHPALVAQLVPAKSYGPVVILNDGPVTGEQVGRAIKAVFRLLGIPGVPHQLRHCFASELASASGGDMLLVSRLLGHSSPATSMIYAELAGGEASRVVDLMWVA